MTDVTDVTPELLLSGGPSPVVPPTQEAPRAEMGQTMRRWAGRGAWAVADQGLFAVSNFAIGVLLARWLSPSDYGSFSIAYAVFLFLGTLHTALLTEPMLVFGSVKYAEAFPTYLRRLVRGHWIVAGAGGLLLALVGAGMQASSRSPVAATLITTGLMAPFILLPWLARRACFAQLQPQWAAASGAVYLALMLSGANILFRLHLLSPVTAILLLGGCSAVVGVALVSVLGRDRRKDAPVIDVADVLADHWTYGRWALMSSAIGWFPSNIFVVLLPAVGGLAASAALKALMNLIMPLLHGITALATLLLPSMVRVRGTAAFRTTLVTALALFVAGALAYWLLIASFARPLLALLYGGRYTENADLMWTLGALPVATAVAGVVGAAVRAIERPFDAFMASAASAVVAGTVGVWLVFRWHLAGAVLGLIVSSMTTGVVLLIVLARRSRQAGAPQGSGDLL